MNYFNSKYIANVLTIKTTGTGNCGGPAGTICTIYGKGLYKTFAVYTDLFKKQSLTHCLSAVVQSYCEIKVQSIIWKIKDISN